MKLTQIFGKQHLERMARRHWFVQGKKKIILTKAEECVSARGFPVLDAVEFVSPKPPALDFDERAVTETPLPRDHNHPDYKADPCYIYDDTNVLLGGLNQAQVLTNTVVSAQELPDALLKNETSLKISATIHEQLQKKILLSCVFDAEQKKLPVRKDPLRPAWNFPRDMGITDVRKNELLCSHLLRVCDQVQKLRSLSWAENVKFSLPLNAHGKQMQLQLSAELLGVCQTPLSPPVAENDLSELPVLHPLDCTISLQPRNFYQLQDYYPGSSTSPWRHAHTAFLHFNRTQVHNLFDGPVTPDQEVGRLLLKAFCIAASQARAQKKGKVSSPVTVQAVQTDGQLFSFAVYQLNTLDVEGGDGKRNKCWLTRPIPLYSTCAVVSGRPVLLDYNPAVLLRLLAFLTNQ